MTDEEFSSIGFACRNAEDGNLLVGSFAAELAGESYPFSAAMSAIMFKSYSDLQLGRKFVEWNEAARSHKGNAE